jgi:hypothetical protein
MSAQTIKTPLASFLAEVHNPARPLLRVWATLL